MLVLGLILVLGSVALGAGIAYDGSETETVEILGNTVDTTAAGVFFTGAATMLVFVLGVWLLTTSMGRSRRKRGERKASRRQQRESVAQLEADRAKLAKENERLSQKLDVRRDEKTTVDKTPTDTPPADGSVDVRQGTRHGTPT